MKKKNYVIFSLFSLSVLLFTGCDKIPDGTVDFQTVDYKVSLIEAPTSVVHTKSDSVIVTSVKITNTQSIAYVWCKINSSNGNATIVEKARMYDDGISTISGDLIKGDGIYTCKMVMKQINPNGKYQIVYYAEDNVNDSPNNLVMIGSALFTFYNGQNNLPPTISNVNLPTIVDRGVIFPFSVDVTDPNGLMDIQSVYYRLYNPNGVLLTNSQGISNFPMFDDGNTVNDGDITGGDGTYSVILKFPLTQPAGLWKLVFQTKDHNGELSNEITQTITVN
jgi:hypothetical protein